MKDHEIGTLTGVGMSYISMMISAGINGEMIEVDQIIMSGLIMVALIVVINRIQNK